MTARQRSYGPRRSRRPRVVSRGFSEATGRWEYAVFLTPAEHDCLKYIAPGGRGEQRLADALGAMLAEALAGD